MSTIIVWSKEIVIDRVTEKVRPWSLTYFHPLCYYWNCNDAESCSFLFCIASAFQNIHVLVISDDLKFMLGVFIKHCIWIGIIYSLYFSLNKNFNSLACLPKLFGSIL